MEWTTQFSPVETDKAAVAQFSGKETSTNETSEFKAMIASLMAIMEAGYKTLLKELKESNENFEDIETRARINNEIEKLDKRVESNLKGISNLDKEVVMMENTIKENSDVVLRRQGERVGQRKVEENNAEELDLDGSGEVQEIISSHCNENSVSRIPCREKEDLIRLYVPRLDGVTEIVEVKASRASCFISQVTTNSKSNNSQIASFTYVKNFESIHLFHSKHFDESWQVHTFIKSQVSAFRLKCRSQHKNKIRGS
jgi:hypothetical protein